jgi:hypothetical protein
VTISRLSTLMLATVALAAAANPVAVILDEARSAPVEVFADAVFHLIETNRIPPPDRAALLDEVFLRATGAHEAMPERPAASPTRPAAPTPLLPIPAGANVHYSPAARVPGVAIRAQLRLDTLSIQCRVVRALLGIDGKHARELFSRIPRPDVPKPDCKGAILKDPSPYFETVEAVVTQAPFSDKEQAERLPFWIVESTVHGIQTSLEIIPAARNLSHLVQNEKDALAMTSAFAAALGIEDTDRNFSGAIGSNLLDALQVVEDRFAKLGVPPQALQAALRGYLVRHLTAARCEDSTADYAGVAAAFNGSLEGQTGVPPIGAEESMPSKVEGKADIDKPLDKSTYQDLLKQVNAVLRDPNAPTDVLAQLGAWKPADGEDPVAVFHNKIAWYLAILGSDVRLNGTPERPHGPLFPAVVQGLVATVSDPAILDLAPCDWLEEVQAVDRQIGMQFGADMNGQFTPIMFAPDIAQALASSSLPALQVYGRMAILEHPSWLTFLERK